jgi:hypothetical protein
MVTPSWPGRFCKSGGSNIGLFRRAEIARPRKKEKLNRSAAHLN